MLEVGAGYTTIHALQALADNDAELDRFRAQQRRHKNPADDGFAWPKLNWANEGYLERAGGYSFAQLHCIDNMAHTGTTARLVSSVAAELQLEDRLLFTEG